MKATATTTSPVVKKYKVLTGKVIQDQAMKTINVVVSTYKNHPVYQKRYLSSKKYLVHDEHNRARIGDQVRFIASRPWSKRKKFRLLKIITKAKPKTAN